MNRNFEILRKEARERQQIDRRAAGKRSKPGARPFSPEMEIRNLVSSVFLAATGKGGAKAVLFCATEETPRCDWICARAAETLAMQTRARVCAVDGNLHTAGLHEEFGQSLAPGFRNAMQSKQSTLDFVKPTWVSNLSLLGAGYANGDVPSAWDPARIGRVIQELRGRFEYVLVSAPPAALYLDALCIGCFLDGAVLVLTANSTRREVARTTKERLESAGVRVLGAILDRRTYPIPEAIYRRL